MPVYGNLSTMSLEQVLSWAGQTAKTGVLDVERNKISKRIEFRKGWIGSCSSNDPSSRLGQFLLSRGKVTEDELRRALDQQQVTGKRLGLILVESGVLRRSELTRQVAAKAEETIHSLFDWDDAVFRFFEGATLDPDQIEVNLSVDEIVQSGSRRQTELVQIRESLTSSGVVFKITDQPVPESVTGRTLSKRIFELIDGEKTIGEIVLHARANEFRVVQFLHALLRRGLVEIAEVQPVVPEACTLLDPEPGDEHSCAVGSQELPEAAALLPDEQHPRTAEGPGTWLIDNASEEETVEQEIAVARRLLDRGEYEAALELLNASYRVRPDHGPLKRLIDRSEKDYVDALTRTDMTPSKVPVLLEPRRPIASALASEQSFLLSLIDGKIDVKSLTYLAPLREVDVLRTLRQMLRHRQIVLEDPEPTRHRIGPTR